MLRLLYLLLNLIFLSFDWLYAFPKTVSKTSSRLFPCFLKLYLLFLASSSQTPLSFLFVSLVSLVSSAFLAFLTTSTSSFYSLFLFPPHLNSFFLPYCVIPPPPSLNLNCVVKLKCFIANGFFYILQHSGRESTSTYASFYHKGSSVFAIDCTRSQCLRYLSK